MHLQGQSENMLKGDDESNEEECLLQNQPWSLMLHWKGCGCAMLFRYVAK